MQLSRHSFPSVLISTVLFISRFCAASIVQRSSYDRPSCALEESCSVDYPDYDLQMDFCDCPESTICQPDGSVEVQGAKYKFCNQRRVPKCAPGEIALSVRGIVTSVHCECPPGIGIDMLPTVGDGVARFECSLTATWCAVGAACGSEAIAGSRQNCACPPGTGCVVASSPKNATCQPLFVD